MNFRHKSILTTMAVVALSSSAIECSAGDRASGKQAGGQSSCQSCQTGCDVCGTGALCCDPMALEAIDVDSLTPAAQSKQLFQALQARLIFTVPEDADIYLSGQKMSTLGVARTFTVSVNDPTLTYRYDIRVEVVRNGKKYFKQETLKILKAGTILAIEVAAPPVPEGLPAQIAFAIGIVQPGGPPVPEAPPGDAPAEDEEAPLPPMPPAA